MSESGKDSRAGLTGIPRLKSSSKMPSPVVDSCSGSDGKQTAAPACNGNQRQKSGISDSHGKGLSLQGPFNPNIVASVRKPGDKRKKPEYNGGKFLSSVKSYEDLASKRSTQSQKEKTKGYRELKKSEEELHKKVLHLEVSLRDLNLLRNEEVTSLSKQLTEANEKAGTLDEELKNLKKEYVNYKATSTSEFHEQESSLLKTNKKLQEKMDSCIKKLQESNINPVSLESMDSNQQAIEAKRQKAVEQALSLQQKLKELSEKNTFLMENIQSCIDGSG